MKKNLIVTTAFALAAAVLILAGCKKDDKGSNAANSRKVEYRVLSPFSDITTITYTDETGTDKSLTPAKGTSWSSGVLTIPKSADSSLSITAQAPGNSSTNLTVQIYVDGSLKKEAMKKGANEKGIMIATATY